MTPDHEPVSGYTVSFVVLCLLVALLFCGCVVYHVPTPMGEATLKTFCKTVDIPKITYTASNATIIVEGYTSKGDAEVITASAGAIGAIVGAAIKATAK